MILPGLPAKSAEGVAAGRNVRLADDRYCAPCGFLYWQLGDARAHREQAHPEQARFERVPLEVTL